MQQRPDPSRPKAGTRACNLCGRVVLMHRFQRFCRACRKRVRKLYIPRQGRLTWDPLCNPAVRSPRP